jgi:hypothetical protein
MLPSHNGIHEISNGINLRTRGEEMVMSYMQGHDEAEDPVDTRVIANGLLCQTNNLACQSVLALRSRVCG